MWSIPRYHQHHHFPGRMWSSLYLYDAIICVPCVRIEYIFKLGYGFPKLLIIQIRELRCRQSPLSRSNADGGWAKAQYPLTSSHSHLSSRKYSFKCYFLKFSRKTFEKFFLCLGFKMKLASSGYNCVCQFGKIGDLEKWGHSPGEI